jgi:dienelactone hydrolase
MFLRAAISSKKLLVCVVALMLLNLNATAVKMEQTSFTSGGKTIEVNAHFTELETAPAIIVLHGAGGVDAGNRYVGHLAAAVAAHGYSTFVVEYFDRTGTTYASDTEIHKHFDAWVETIKDAVTFVAQQPRVDAEKIGTFGYSLGGYLAVAHAARDPRVRATVELAGGVDRDYSKQVKRLPPLLIVHGREDQRVLFARGVELEKFARGLGSAVETEYYPGERHILSPVAALRALGRALDFFQTHLK